MTYADPLGSQLSLLDWVLHSDAGLISAENVTAGDSLAVSVGDLLGKGGTKRIGYRVRIDNVNGLPSVPGSDDDDAKLLLSQGVVTYRDPVSGEMFDVLTDYPGEPGDADKTPMIVHGVETMSIHLPLMYR